MPVALLQSRRTSRSSAALAAFVCVAAGLGLSASPGCGEEDVVTVSTVKRTFAEQAVTPVGAVSSLGSITAERFDAGTFDLRNVHVTMSDDFFLRAGRAELVVDPERDTMMIRFTDVMWTTPTDGAAASESASLDGVLHEAPVRVTPAWSVGVDVVGD